MITSDSTREETNHFCITVGPRCHNNAIASLELGLTWAISGCCWLLLVVSFCCSGEAGLSGSPGFIPLPVL